MSDTAREGALTDIDLDTLAAVLNDGRQLSRRESLALITNLRAARAERDALRWELEHLDKAHNHTIRERNEARDELQQCQDANDALVADLRAARAVIREAVDVFRAANWDSVGFAIEQAAVGEPATDDYNAFELRIYNAVRALVEYAAKGAGDGE